MHSPYFSPVAEMQPVLQGAPTAAAHPRLSNFAYLVLHVFDMVTGSLALYMLSNALYLSYHASHQGDTINTLVRTFVISLGTQPPRRFSTSPNANVDGAMTFLHFSRRWYSCVATSAILLLFATWIVSSMVVRARTARFLVAGSLLAALLVIYIPMAHGAFGFFWALPWAIGGPMLLPMIIGLCAPADSALARSAVPRYLKPTLMWYAPPPARAFGSFPPEMLPQPHSVNAHDILVESSPAPVFASTADKPSADSDADGKQVADL